jgi:hypothetical protein
MQPPHPAQGVVEYISAVQMYTTLYALPVGVMSPMLYYTSPSKSTHIFELDLKKQENQYEKGIFQQSHLKTIGS